MIKQTKRPFILAAIMLAMFVSAVEATIVATVMPGIVVDLGGFSLFSWVFSAYLLMQVMTIPIYGKLADMYGRKKIFAIGMFFFLLGSLLCGFSTSMEMLILSRLIQGIGAGAVQPMATTIIGDIYTKEERANIQGYLSSVWGISAVAGPLIGATIVQYFHWAWVFWVNIPLGIFSVIIIIIFLKEPVNQTKQQVDFVGAFLLLIAIASVMILFLETGLSWTWQDPIFWGLLILAMICFVLFIYQENRVKDPIMTLSLWQKKDVAIANIASFSTGAVLLAISSFLPTYVQGALSATPLIAGLTLTVISIGWPLSAMIAGKILLKIGFRSTALIGATSLVIGTVCYNVLPWLSTPAIAAVGSFFIGMGLGFMTTTFIVSIQSAVEWKVRGEATSLNLFMRQLGGSVGVAFLGGLLNYRIKQVLESSQDQLGFEPTLDAVSSILEGEQNQMLSSFEQMVIQQGLQEGYQVLFIALLMLAAITFVTVMFLPKDQIEQTKQQT
ncbi:MDR family MFS transporter [Alkalihalobacillus pseudalcaliphilus]|uniref:MDR family MFS transporter n=1 Tax=Alkalihalobacillus pseudalcaliphilus TaxID=79884 RepID=UPI00064DD81C|nr:MDR family MFS transporter [Alkalihalobacillus pseudalcaliphilus]KMK75756.1 MFS transporter [Alkalihalobacillus pseudalcaliphilus]